MIGNELTIPTSENYRRFGAMEARGKSSLYEELALAVAEDNELVELLSLLPLHKRQPNLLFGAVRYLYGTAAGYQEFRECVLGNWDGISNVMLAKRTQTNEVGRCAALLPLLAALPEPLQLLEVGASAGLCLWLDHFGYDFGEHVLNPESPVQLQCELRGFEAPMRIPQIEWRLGIDIEPVDASAAEDRRWLETLVWPGMETRAARLRAALDLVQYLPPVVRRGDVRDGIRAVIGEAPHAGTTVVFHSAVLAYLARDERERFVDEVIDAGVTWISYEGVGVSHVPGPPGTGGRDFVIALNGQPVARADGHGAWVERW